MPQHKRKAELSEAEIAAEERKQEIISRVQSLDAEATKEYLFQLCDRWQLQFPNRTFSDVLKTAFENFDVPPEGDIDVTRTGQYGLTELDATIHSHEMEAIALYHHLRQHNLIVTEADAENEEAAELLNKILKILEMVYYSKKIVLSAFQAKLAIHQVHCEDMVLQEDIDARLGSWSLRFRWIDGNLNEMQELLLFLLDSAFEKRLRKQEGYVFEPILVNDKYNSHAFRRVCEIKEWVYMVTQKELQWHQWVNVTHGTNTLKATVDYLTSCDDYQFPNLVKDRTVFSFKNGIYLATENRFYDYETATEPLAESIVACKYFDQAFDPYEEILDWKLIPTPAFQGILDYQELPPEVAEWLYVFLGKMLYDLNQYDGWQVLPFLKGHAGTGKSTICTHVVRNFYDAIDVGVLSNNIERKFGISAFYDKNIFIGPECRNDLAIEQAEFQSIVSGEDIQVNMKHKKAFSVKWHVPGILAGNEVPSWADAAGSIQRRLPVFDFEKPVVNGDMRLGQKIEDELPDLIVKCNRAYREKAAQHGSANIWSILPAYFQRTSNELAQTINALEAFLACDEVTFGPECAVPFDEFKNCVVAYAQINGYTRPKFSIDYFRGPFTRRQIQKEKCTRTWRGRVLTRDFLLGVDLAVADVGAGNALG